MDDRAGRVGEFVGAADVVGVVMCEQDRAQPRARARQRVAYRRGFARVDADRIAAAIGEQPDEVVGQRGHGEKAHGRRTIGIARAAVVKRALARRRSRYTS
jgi:hypothetical protein